MRTPNRGVLGAVALWTAAALEAWASTGETTRIAPAADKVLRDLSSYIRSATNFTCDAVLVMNSESEGMKQEITVRYGLTVERPNRLALRHRGGMPGNTVVSDGRTVYTYLPVVNRVVSREAPPGLEAIAGSADIMTGNMFFLENLLRPNPYETLLEGVSRAVYVGTDDRCGLPCHRVRFEQKDLDWDLWVAADDRPLVRRVEGDASRGFAGVSRRTPGMGNVKVTFVNQFENWVVNTNLPADAFAFSAPADAKELGSDAEGEDMDEPGEEEAPLVGAPAPAFRLPLLGGGTFEVPLPGQTNVAVVSFWASWCGYCRRSLPGVARAAGQYRDRGVLFCAVDVGEDEDTVRAFLKQVPLDGPVALDRDSAAGALYRTDEGIPRTVLIARDGTVRFVHVGYAPDLDRRLGEEIEGLLAPEPSSPDARP
jgi:peroxiredoxin